MANEQNQLPTPDIPADAPTHEDGGQSPAPNIELRPAQNRIDVETDKQEPQEWKDDKRNAIFAKSRKNRAQETVEFSGDANDPNARYGTAAPREDEIGSLEQQAIDRQRQNQQQQVAAATGQQPPQQPQPQMRGLDPQIASAKARAVIDGVEKEVTFEEALRHYQMHGAADNRLATAKALTQQAHEMMQNAAYQAGQASRRQDDDDSDDDDEHTSPSGVDQKALIEKIQLGTSEEAMEALNAYFDSRVGPQQQGSTVDDDTRVLTALENMNSRNTIQKFAEQNPDIYDPIVQGPTTEMSRHIMALQIRNAAQARGIPDERLREIIRSPEDLREFHKQARINRVPGISSTEEILKTAYKHVKETFRRYAQPQQPQPAQRGAQQQPHQAVQVQPQRQDRKAALQQQPAQRQRTTATNTQPRTQDQARKSAFAQIRQARGQTV